MIEYTVSDIDSLNNLKNDRAIKDRIRKIKIDINKSNPLDIRELEHDINKHYFACGCEQGTISVYISLLALLTIWLVDTTNILIHWKFIICILLSSAFVGKAIGLIYSRYKLRFIYAKINLALQN